MLPDSCTLSGTMIRTVLFLWLLVEFPILFFDACLLPEEKLGLCGEHVDGEAVGRPTVNSIRQGVPGLTDF